jgi:hypothetical protein
MKRFSGDLFEVTLAVASIPAEFLRYWIPAVAARSVIRPGFVDAVSFVGVKAECDAHRLTFGESALALGFSVFAPGRKTEAIVLVTGSASLRFMTKSEKL